MTIRQDVSPSPGSHLHAPELRGRRPRASFPYSSRPAQIGLRSVWAGPQQVAVNLLESASPFIVSDTLQQQDQTATSTLWEFFSDSEIQAGVVPGPVLVETGAVQPTLVITYFNASNAVIGTDTLNIQSDAPEGVPEPATVVLGLSGLVLIGAWRLRASSTVMSPDRY